MTSTISYQATLETEECCNCSILFAMPVAMMKRLRQDGGSFYCPNGHSQHYTKTENQKLREQLEATQKNLTSARCETMAERQAREVAEKKLKRVGKGVCPCCRRSFTNLRRHIATKHPQLTK